MDQKNTSSSYVRALDMENFNWTLSDCTNDSAETIDLKVEASSYTPKNSTAVISGSIRLVVYSLILI
jgi:hypothetical protein